MPYWYITSILSDEITFNEFNWICIALHLAVLSWDGWRISTNQSVDDWFWINESMNESMNEWIDSDWNDWTPLKLMNDWVISHDDEAWLAALTHHWPTWAAQSASKRAGRCLQRCQINVGHPRHWPKSGKAAGFHFICSIGPALNSVANWPIKCPAGNLATFLALLPHFCSLWWPLVAFGGLWWPFAAFCLQILGRASAPFQCWLLSRAAAVGLRPESLKNQLPSGAIRAESKKCTKTHSWVTLTSVQHPASSVQRPANHEPWWQ